MKYEGHETTSTGSLDIRFSCPFCDRVVSLVTNSGETQMISSFGVKIGGESVSKCPFDITKGSLKESFVAEPSSAGSESAIRWTDAAQKRLENVPPFAQPMAKRAIEKFAKDHGHEEITLEVMDEAKKVVGH
jgi:hypothetical protein